MKPKVIVIVGPTASGKTAISIEIAKCLNGEIVSADSMQIYKYMNIGTAKPTLIEQNGICHHMIDVVMPSDDFNVATYKSMAENAIDEIISKNKIPIVVGGTGLYINTLINGIDFNEIECDNGFREEMHKKVLEEGGKEFLFSELQKIDPDAAKIIDKNNVRRVIRALEIYKVTGKTKTQLDKESIKEVKYDYRVFGLDWPRDEIYARINDRVDMMIDDGLIDEVEKLLNNYNFSRTALQALGYKEVKEYLDSKISKEEMIEKIKNETRHYAKRQLTWFKKDSKIVWISPKNKDLCIKMIIEKFYE